MSTPIDDWMDGYLRAWDSNEPDDIRALFTEDAEYYAAPHVPPARGHDEIVAWWLDSKDEPGDYTFSWVPVAVTASTAVIRGRTDYHERDSYENLWVMELAPDGRATRYTEWYMTVNDTDPGPDEDPDDDADDEDDDHEIDEEEE